PAPGVCGAWGAVGAGWAGEGALPPGDGASGQRLLGVGQFRLRKDDAVKRPFIGTAAFAAFVVIAGFAPSVSAQTHSVAQRGAHMRPAALPHGSDQDPLCSSRASLCADPYDNPNGSYVG